MCASQGKDLLSDVGPPPLKGSEANMKTQRLSPANPIGPEHSAARLTERSLFHKRAQEIARNRGPRGRHLRAQAIFNPSAVQDHQLA